VKLTNDISVTTMAGGYFSGTFDGDGHTITANISGTEAMALFKRIDGGTIKNLTVAGSISGGQHTAGLLVSLGNSGANLVQNSVVSATVNCSSSHMGGFLAHGNNSSVTFDGCVFSGKMTGGSSAKGVFYGWGDAGGTSSLNNCLYLMATGQDLTGLDLVNLNGATTTVTNTYKTTSAGTYGTQAYAITPGTGVTVANAGAAGNTYNVSGLTFYATGLKCGDANYAASGNSVSLTLGSKSGYTTSGYTASAGTLSGSENPYTLTMPGSNVTISAASCTANALTTDGSGNYLINNTDDWNAFCAHVEFGNAFSGATVKLTDDISVTTMAGSYTSDDDYHPFSGTFDGDGHTLTLNVSKQGRFAAPFKCVKDAGCVFDGTMTGSTNTRCAGIAGYEYIATTTVISNTLFAPTTLTVSTADDGYTKTISRDDAPTITNCYYTEALGTAQGTEAIAVTTAPANLGSLVEDYGMVKAYQNGILVGGTYYVAPASISLANAADNSTTISNANGYVANVTLADRTLYKDGAWNTICLPFDVTIAGSPLAGATARPLTSASISGSTLTLTFGDAVTTLKAGTPYIIKWTKPDPYVAYDGTNADGTSDIVSPVFSGVTIDADADGNYDTETASPAVTTDERVRFLGTYKSTTFDAEDKSILLMGGGNALYYPTTGVGLGAQRAYFKIGDDNALLARRLTAFNIGFGEDDATGIISIENGKLKIENDADAWYSLDGRKLQGKPSRAGVYINNGIKVVIK